MEKKAITAQLIGMNIRKLRVVHGETQEELGEILGYGATTVTGTIGAIIVIIGGISTWNY